jgi:hypothetical protein
VYTGREREREREGEGERNRERESQQEVGGNTSGSPLINRLEKAR